MKRTFEVSKMHIDKINVMKSRIYSKYEKMIYQEIIPNPNSESNSELTTIIKVVKGVK